MTGCKDSVTAEDLDKVEMPTKNISYQKYIQPILTQRCAQSGCHNDESRAGGLSFTTWSNTHDPAVLVPGNAANSRIYQVLLPGGSPSMPPLAKSYITKEQIAALKLWIDEGANNN
jgi:uncharacterized membrane protein